MKHIARSGWHYKSTAHERVQYKRKENRYLFKAATTRNQNYRVKIQSKINRNRSRNRIRGNVVFSKRKYKRT